MINHLSYSSVQRWLTCGRSWKYSYIDKEVGPRSANLLFGSAVHTTIADLIQGKGINWRRHWQQQLAESGAIEWGKDNPTELENYGLKMFSDREILAELGKLSPASIQGITAVEFPISLSVPGVSVPVVGFIDYIGADMVPVDFKTASRSWSQEQADKELQAAFYLAAMNQLDLVSLPAKFRYIVLVKNKTPKIQIINTTRTAQDVWRVYNLVTDVYKAIQAEIFPINPNSWSCDQRYCQHWQRCQGGLNK